ncbi:hypothetical protein Hanom_Chr07g00672081 [Helianthus anomalus]
MLNFYGLQIFFLFYSTVFFIIWRGSYADSLMHNTIVAEMIYCLEPNKMGEVIKVIEESLKTSCVCVTFFWV